MDLLRAFPTCADAKAAAKDMMNAHFIAACWKWEYKSVFRTKGSR